MGEIPPKTRARIIFKLGRTINDEYSANVTEPIVVELVKLLDPTNETLQLDHYKRYAEDDTA